MTATLLTTRQRFILVMQYLMDELGFPVSYRDYAFTYFKERENWSRLPGERIRLLSRMFCREAEEIEGFVAEAEGIVIEERGERLGEKAIEMGNPMGKTDRITLYAAIRASQPGVVVETGTAAGASATYILSAMEKNGRGALYSIDDAYDHTHIGYLVPEHLRSRLNFHYGNSMMLIPEVYHEVHQIDCFIHDSLHTYEHMTAEYELFYRLIEPGGVICSHDILMSNAWRHFMKRHRLHNWGAVKNLGLCRIEKSPTCATG